MSDDDKQWISGRLEAIREEMNERLEAKETKLLKAFYDWAQTYEVRHSK